MSYFIPKDIIEDLKSELGGIFEDVILALMKEPDQYLCEQLNKCMDGIGTEESTLIEILCPKSNEEVKQIVAKYEDGRFYKCYISLWAYLRRD